jgi:PKD repeat protein
MADPTPEKEKKGGWLKAAVLGVLGLSGGAAGTYVTAVVEKIAKPPLPVANFAASTDGLTLTCQNHASGDSGWWDFGDGSPLEPFSPETPSVTHAYTKPGTYSVKLIVRNFTADENQRSVPVEVAEVGKDGPNAPSVSDFTIRSVSPVAVAPATFRVTAEVKNAEHCIWDFGDGRLEVADAGGKIDRLVTFEKSGAFLVQLFVHNGKQAAKQVSTVKVEAPDNGALTAVLTVTDTGTRTERVVRNPSVAITAHSEKGTPEFTRTVMARPGFVIEDAAPAIATVAGIANLAVRVGGRWHLGDHLRPVDQPETWGRSQRFGPHHPAETDRTTGEADASDCHDGDRTAPDCHRHGQGERGDSAAGYAAGNRRVQANDRCRTPRNGSKWEIARGRLRHRDGSRPGSDESLRHPVLSGRHDRCLD